MPRCAVALNARLSCLRDPIQGYPLPIQLHLPLVIVDVSINTQSLKDGSNGGASVISTHPSN